MIGFIANTPKPDVLFIGNIDTGDKILDLLVGEITGNLNNRFSICRPDAVDKGNVFAIVKQISLSGGPTNSDGLEFGQSHIIPQTIQPCSIIPGIVAQ